MPSPHVKVRAPIFAVGVLLSSSFARPVPSTVHPAQQCPFASVVDAISRIMSVAFTFGSLGDIIALTGLINELIEVLDDSRGSVKDYSGVVFRLRIQLNTVNRVAELFGGPARNQKEADIQADVRQVLQQIRDCIDDFLAKLAKFAPSLSNGGSGNNVKDVLKKVSWRLERKEIEAFERNVMIHTSSLDVFIGVTTWYAVESVRDQLSEQIARNNNESKATLEAQSNSLRQLQAFMIAIGRALLSTLNQVSQACQDIQQTIAQGLLVGLSILTKLQVIIGQLERLAPPLEDIYFVLVDHLGGRNKVLLTNILSWDMFYDLLALGYRNEKGARRLARQRFVLERNMTNTEIDRSTPWESAFKHSQVVHLTLTWQQDDLPAQGVKVRCPRCWVFEEEIDTQTSMMTCLNCDLKFTVSAGSAQTDHSTRSILDIQDPSRVRLKNIKRDRRVAVEDPEDSDEEDMTGLARIRVLMTPRQHIAEHHTVTSNTKWMVEGDVVEEEEDIQLMAAAAAAAAAGTTAEMWRSSRRLYPPFTYVS